MRAAPVFWCATLLATAPIRAEEFKTVAKPFQVQLLSLHRQRDLMLVRGPWVWVDEEGFQRTIDRKTPKSRSQEGPSFYARLRLTTDPPTVFRQDGPVTVVEAVDELDQTLEASPDESDDPKRKTAPRVGGYASVDLRMPLSLPDQPGKTIKRLRGTIPVVVSTRSAEPVAVVAVSEAKGRTIATGDVTMTCLDVKTDMEGRTVIALLARLKDTKVDPRDREAQGRAARRLTDVSQLQIDLIDDQTRSIPIHPSSAVRRDENRITIRITPGDDHGPPDRLRVYGLSRERRELPFDFQGVPLP